MRSRNIQDSPNGSAANSHGAGAPCCRSSRNIATAATAANVAAASLAASRPGSVHANGAIARWNPSWWSTQPSLKTL